MQFWQFKRKLISYARQEKGLTDDTEKKELLNEISGMDEQCEAGGSYFSIWE